MADFAATPPPAAPAPPAYKDRSTGLLLFGIFEICLAALAGLAALLALLRFALRAGTAHPAPEPLSFAAPSVFFYILLAIVWAALGVGSIQARRWARALTVVISWFWLLVGIFGVVIATAMMPVLLRTAMTNASPSPQPVPAGVMAGVITVIMALTAIFYVGVPLAFIVFYSSDSVRETCRHRDPVERWTDRTPLPIIGASFVLVYGGCAFATTSFSRPVLPLFGWVLMGASARIALLMLGAIWVILAVAIFRRRIWAWWATMAALVLFAASSAVSLLRGGLLRVYQQTGMAEQQLQMLRVMLKSPVFVWGMLSLSIVFLGYVIWLRRYFVSTAGEATPDTALLPHS